MDELLLRELLEQATDGEPPAGPLARNSLLAGIRLRRRRRVQVAASAVAVLAVAGASMFALISSAAGLRPQPAGGSESIVYVVSAGGTGRAGSVTAIGTATGTVLRTIRIPAGGADVAVTPDGRTLYVTDSRGVTPVNTVTGTAGKSIYVGKNSLGASFLGLAITPNGKTVYVANYETDSVVPIDIATNTPGKPIRVGAAPDAIAITPDGKTAYVANGAAHSVTPINIATDTAGTPIQTGDWPGPIAITPDGKTVYVADNGANTVTPISTATNKAGPPIRVGATPAWLAITLDGRTVYVLNALDGQSTVTPISTSTNKAGKPFNVPGQPGGIVITPDGKTAYVADDQNVLAISTASGTSGRAIPVHGAFVIAASLDGKTVYVITNSSDTVTPISTASGAVGSPIPVGAGPTAIAVAPGPN